MQAEPSPFCREASPLDTPRHCVFVTGPRGAGKTRELQLQIHDLAEQQPGARCAVLLAEEGRTRMEGFAQGTPGVAVRRLLLPCTCCPALADLPGALRALVAAARPGWLLQKCRPWPRRAWWQSLHVPAAGRANWSSAWTGSGRRTSASTRRRPSKWFCWNSRTAWCRIPRGAGFHAASICGRVAQIGPPPPLF